MTGPVSDSLLISKAKENTTKRKQLNPKASFEKLCSHLSFVLFIYFPSQWVWMKTTVLAIKKGKPQAVTTKTSKSTTEQENQKKWLREYGDLVNVTVK